MPAFVTVVLIVLGVLLLLYLLLKFNSVWIYRTFDHALGNDRRFLPRAYEVPRYTVLHPSGAVDTSVPWPGWDGWYFFMVPDDKVLPVQLIRASLMTGLYGLEGIDNYEKLLLRLSTFEAVEHLALIPTEVTVPAGKERAAYLSHHYLPKQTNLTIAPDRLDVAITGVKMTSNDIPEQYGRIRGAWPHYYFESMNPEAEINVALNYSAENIIWWADIPHVFTYFAVFGTFDGTMTYRRGTRKDDPHELLDHAEVYPLRGKGYFEHGFARKPFDFDRFGWLLRGMRTIVSSLSAIRYHYELLIGDEDFTGGFMQVRALGINFRDRGGFYRGSTYREMRSITIEYLERLEPDRVGTCQGVDFVTFYRQWQVRAVTDGGMLEYTATRQWPAAPISQNMLYYHFSYVGTYQGQRISGRGYGEYLSL